MPLDLRALDIAWLTPIVRQDQRRPQFELLDWTVAPLAHQGIINPEGLYRCAGRGRDADGERPWSVVLKVLREPAVEVDPADLWYWRREACAAEAAVLARLPGPLRAPRIYAVTERAGSVWLWMEHVADTAPPRWPLETFAQVAGALGRMSGAYLTARALPSFPWLCRGHARRWLASMPLDSGRACGLVQHAFSHPILARIDRLWHARDERLAVLDRLPQVFSHFDLQRRNVLMAIGADRQPEPVAIDWAWCGLGPVGGDLASLIGHSALLFEVDAPDLPAVEAMAFEAYVQGLRAAGWTGDPNLARLGYATWFALVLGAAAPGLVAFWTEGSAASAANRLFGRAGEALAAGWAEVAGHALGLEDEAAGLLPAVGP
jgi:hypothetical protein